MEPSFANADSCVLYGSAFCIFEGRGPVRLGETAFPYAVCLAPVEGTGAAPRSAIKIARRADILLILAPKGTTKGGMNTKPHGVTYANGRSVRSAITLNRGPSELLVCGGSATR